jgi:hypothetical protein
MLHNPVHADNTPHGGPEEPEAADLPRLPGAPDDPGPVNHSPLGGQLGLLLPALPGAARAAEGWGAGCPVCQGGPDTLLLVPDEHGNVTLVRCANGCDLRALLDALGIQLGTYLNAFTPPHATGRSGGVPGPSLLTPPPAGSPEGEPGPGARDVRDRAGRRAAGPSWRWRRRPSAPSGPASPPTSWTGPSISSSAGWLPSPTWATPGWPCT